MSYPGRHSSDRGELAGSPADAHSSSWTNDAGSALLPRVRTRGSPAPAAAPGKSLSANDHVAALPSSPGADPPYQSTDAAYKKTDSNAPPTDLPARNGADLPTRAHTMNDALTSSASALPSSTLSSSALASSAIHVHAVQSAPDSLPMESGKSGKPRRPIPGQMTPLAALLGSPQTAGIALSGPDASPPPMLLPSPPVSPVGNSCAGDGEASAFLPADSASAAGGAGRRAPRRAGSWRVSESAGRAEGVGGSGGDSPHGVAEGEAGEAGGAGEGGCFYESVRVPRDVVRVWQDCWRGAWQADVEIRSAVDGGLVLAQGAVLAAHSQGLERMLAGAMLQQARPPWVIVLKGVPVEAIRGVVQALYCGTMDDALMDRHVFHLLLLAHSLPIPLLKSLCLEALRSRLLSPTNAVDTLVLARLVGSRALQALTQQYIVRHHADVALTDAWAMLSQEYPDVKQMLVQMVEARKRRDTGLHGEEAWARQQVQQAVRALEHICNDGSCATSASASASVSSPPPAAPPCAAPASASSAEPSSASAVESGGGRAGTGVEGDGAEEGGGGRRMEGAEGEEAKGREPGGAATAAVGAATAAVGAATAAVGAATAAVGAAADTSSTDSQNQPDEILQSQGGQKGPIGQLGHSGPNTLSPTTTLAPTLSSLSSSSSLLSVRPMSPPTPATPAVPPTPCGLPKCRPVEGLIRHFAKCGVKVSGGCGSCKVVWQLLEQHSSACEKHKGCRVPLCRQFKSKQQQEQGSGLPAAGKEKLSAAEHAEQVTALAKALLALEDAKSF